MAYNIRIEESFPVGDYTVLECTILEGIIRVGARLQIPLEDGTFWERQICDMLAFRLMTLSVQAPASLGIKVSKHPPTKIKAGVVMEGTDSGPSDVTR